MADKVKRGFLFFLMASLCIAFLTGCPRKHTKEEEEQLLSYGREKLTQALEEHYGMKEGDWQIDSCDIYWGSSHGYEGVKYVIKTGDATFQAMVTEENLYYGSDDVFTDYYGKEFEETLAAYLNEKWESLPEWQQGTVQMLSVDFCWPGAAGATRGMIPASVSPEDFGTYLEKCEQERLLDVYHTMAWYSADPEDTMENLRTFLMQDTGKLPSSLLALHFTHSLDEGLRPTDLLKSVNLYYDAGDGSLNQYFTTYEYYEVDEDLIIRRSHYGETVWKPEEKPSFQPKVDAKGYLCINPSDNTYYELFCNRGTEGTYVNYRKKDDKTFYKKTLRKAPYCENWCFFEIRGDWNVEVKHLINNE